MKAYKVVTVNKQGKEELYSFTGGIIYRVGEWAKPKENDGPLAVFDSVESAHKYLSDFCGMREGSIDYENTRVYECEVEPSQHKYLWCYYDGVKESLLEFDLPKGTITADKVKLGEVVSRWF